MSTAQQLQEAADKATQASSQADTWANGPINTTVPTDSGPVPTIAEFTRANQERADSAIDALGWVLAGDFTTGCTVTGRNQYVLVVGGAGYRWDGVLPKDVTPSSSPTPIATGSWVLVGDATLRGELANSDGSELVGFQQSGTGAVARTAESKLSEVVSVKDFGAKGDGITLDNVAIQAAINFVGDNGGGIIDVPPGDYPIGADLVPRSNVIIRGAGRKASRFVVPLGNTTRNTIFLHTNPAQPYENFALVGLGFVGQWGTTKSELSANGLVTLKYINGLTVKDCHLLESRGFALNINECDNVLIEGNLLEFACRDMIAVWGSPRVRVVNNVLRHNDDDGISINWETAGSGPVRSQIIVTGNQLEDTGGIRTQSPKNTVIANNTLSRMRGTGIQLGVVNTSTNNTSSGHANIVEGNIITDVIERQWFISGEQVGSVNNRVYIYLQSIKPIAGALPVPPGEINPVTGQVQSPYDYYYKRGSIAAATGSIRAPSGTLVRNNICMRTLPSVAAYSDWGYGLAYGKDGMLNHPVSEAVLRGQGARIQLPYTSLRVEDNHFECGRYGVSFELAAGVSIASNLAKGIRICKNTIKDCDLFGLYWMPTSLSHQDITIEGNDIDGDPYFVSSNRGVGGTWMVANNGPIAFKFDQLASVTIKGNSLRNCSSTITNSGASALQYVEGNLIYGDLATTAFNVSNKGVGATPGIGWGEQWWVQYEGSDPMSATYKQYLGANLKNSSSMPTTGKYLTGTSIRARGQNIQGAVGSKYVVIGWNRMTTGNSHVLNTDWTELRCLIGT